MPSAQASQRFGQPGPKGIRKKQPGKIGQKFDFSHLGLDQETGAGHPQLASDG